MRKHGVVRLSSDEADDGEHADVDADDLATPDLDALDEAEREKISAAVAEADADSDGQDDAGEEPDSAGVDVPDAEDIVEGEISIGHVYCRSLGLGAAALVNRYDEDEGEDMDALVNEYADLAKQTDLDVYMDQWFEQSMGRSSMSPGQGVAVGTMLFVAMVAISNPAVADGLATEVGL